MSQLKGLPGELHRALRNVLAACGPFDNPAGLRAVFDSAELFDWRNQVPAGADKQALVDETITLLYNNPFDHPNPLVRFLSILADQKEGGCRQELSRLAGEVSAYLGEEDVVQEPAGATGGVSLKPSRAEPAGAMTKIEGGGAAAGAGGTAVGERGVNVSGNVQGDIITGDRNVTFNQQGQTVGGHQTNIAGDAHIGQIGNNINTGGGDYVRGDKHMGDQYNIGNIKAKAAAVGPGATATVNEGDTYSGDFRGAILNVRSTLTNVTNAVGALPGGDDESKAQLEQLISELKAALEKTIEAAPEKADEVEEVADLTELLVTNAAAEKPKKSLIQVTGEGLKQAARDLAEITPSVLDIATKIVAVVAAFMA